MAELMNMANTSEFYKLLYSDLLNLRPFTEGSLKVFYEREFENYFPTSKWRQLYSVAPENPDGSYSQIIGKSNIPVMASYVAYDAEGPTIGQEGFRATSNDMPRMKIAYQFNEKSAKDQARITRNMGNQEAGRVFNQFLTDSTNLIAGIETKNSHTALQIESTGSLISTSLNNRGIAKDLSYDFQVPAANRKKCGGSLPGNDKRAQGKKFSWDDDKSSPIGDLIDMAQYVVDKNLFVKARGVFRMNQATYNKLKLHPDTKARIGNFTTGYLAADSKLANFYVKESELNDYLKDMGLPPIEIEDWVGTVLALNPATQKTEQTTLQGFADDTVLLRPAGMVGEMQWMSPTTMFATAANPMYTTNGNMVGIQQDIFSTAKSMRFTAEFTGITVPNNVEEMVYLRTDQVAS